MQFLYNLFLRLYPPGFRLEFASEMQSVFSQAVTDAARQGWHSALSYFLRELVDFPRSLLWAYWQELHSKSGKAAMDNTSESLQSSQQSESSGSMLALLLGLFPVLLLGFSTILLEARIAFLWMGLVIYPILYLTILITAGVSWYRGSPRWSYSYTGFLLVFSWYLTNLPAPTFTIAGFRFPPHGELWGSWAWLPVLVTLLIVLLVSRSWRPLQQFFQNIRSDWTLYTFLLYSAMPWLSWALFDEIRNRSLVIISLFVADLSIWMGIWFYFHSRTIRQRAYSLFYGLIPASLITVIATSAYWHGRQEFGMTQPGNGYIDALREGLFYVVIFLILFFPGLVSQTKQKLLNLRSA